jgi:hypothetical protein
MRIGETVRHDATQCLNCGKIINAAAQMAAADDKDAAPHPGAVALCLGCGHVMIYADDLSLRELTDAEQVEIAGDPRIVKFNTIRAQAVKLGDILRAQRESHERGVMSVWTIYNRPKDHPQGYIARRHEAGKGPTVDTVTGELDEIRQIFWQVGLLKLSRSAEDEPQIVESWV